MRNEVKVTEDSHVDHGLSNAQLQWVLRRVSKKLTEPKFEIFSFPLPLHLGTVPCGLHGPTMGDDPVPESEVTYAVRGNRKGESRLVGREPRQVRIVTAIVGPHEEEPLVLYTAFGGPPADREPFDLEEGTEEHAKSTAFWAEHALSVD